MILATKVSNLQNCIELNHAGSIWAALAQQILSISIFGSHYLSYRCFAMSFFIYQQAITAPKNNFMKYVLIAFLVIFCHRGTYAQIQKHRVFADLSLPPGFSATYNYTVTKNFAFGFGLQGYANNPTFRYNIKFVPALFADIRLTAWATKKNQFISFMDMGINLYKQDKSYFRDSNDVIRIPHNNGFYAGLGLAYFRRMTKRGGGPYVALKLSMNFYSIKGYSLISDEREIGLINGGGDPILSVGFKF